MIVIQVTFERATAVVCNQEVQQIIINMPDTIVIELEKVGVRPKS